MSETDTKALRALAEAATPGPWKADDRPRSPTSLHSVYALGVGTETIRTNVADHMFANDADLACAANPTAILAILDRVERAERERDEAITGDEITRAIQAASLIAQLRAAHDSLAAQLAQVTTERDTAKQDADRMRAELAQWEVLGERLDVQPRPIGCKCYEEPGDSPCPVHPSEDA